MSAEKILFLGGAAHGKIENLPAPLELTWHVPTWDKFSAFKPFDASLPVVSVKYETYHLHKIAFHGPKALPIRVYLADEHYTKIDHDLRAWNLLAEFLGSKVQPWHGAFPGHSVHYVPPGATPPQPLEPGEYWPHSTPYEGKWEPEPWHFDYTGTIEVTKDPEPTLDFDEQDHLSIQVGDEKIRWDLNDAEAQTLLTWLKQTRGPGKPVS